MCGCVDRAICGTAKFDQIVRDPVLRAIHTELAGGACTLSATYYIEKQGGRALLAHAMAFPFLETGSGRFLLDAINRWCETMCAPRATACRDGARAALWRLSVSRHRTALLPCLSLRFRGAKHRCGRSRQRNFHYEYDHREGGRFNCYSTKATVILTDSALLLPSPPSCRGLLASHDDHQRIMTNVIFFSLAVRDLIITLRDLINVDLALQFRSTRPAALSPVH